VSHFTRIKTRITDRAALVQALADVGYKRVETHDTPQHLYGFLGDRRPQTAEVIVRHRQISWFSNDIGFSRGADGCFEAIISDYDRRNHSQVWLGRLTQRYAYHVARAKLQEQGFDLVSEETARDGRIRLVLRRLA
jgi:hypothetical protein